MSSSEEPLIQPQDRGVNYTGPSGYDWLVINILKRIDSDFRTARKKAAFMALVSTTLAVGYQFAPSLTSGVAQTVLDVGIMTATIGTAAVLGGAALMSEPPIGQESPGQWASTGQGDPKLSHSWVKQIASALKGSHDKRKARHEEKASRMSPEEINVQKARRSNSMAFALLGTLGCALVAGSYIVGKEMVDTYQALDTGGKIGVSAAVGFGTAFTMSMNLQKRSEKSFGQKLKTAGKFGLAGAAVAAGVTLPEVDMSEMSFSDWLALGTASGITLGGTAFFKYLKKQSEEE